MKTKYITILVLFIFSTNLVKGQQNEYIHFNEKELSFEKLVVEIGEQTQTKVFYDPNLVSSIKITVEEDSISIEKILKASLQETNLTVSKWHNHFIILESEQLLEELPNYSQEKEDTVSKTHSQLTKSEERYISGQRPDVIKTIRVGNKNIPSDGKVRIVGKILDIDTGEPIIGATVFIEETKTGSATDLKGYFVIILPPGKFNAVFSSLGYQPSKYKLDVYSDASIKIELKSASFSLQEAVIKGDRQMDIKFKDPGLEKLSVKSIKSIPMMMGEKDILKVSEMLPGIVSAGEGSSGLNVRGGSSDQNAFYLNKIPIYNTSHLFGFFPAFNSDIIKDFSIYKGHIPAEYGGRLSSVFNITTRQGNRKNFALRGGINPISANATVEGPLKKDKSSVLFSARSSYSDWILSRIDDPVINKSSANFNDFSLGLNYDLKKSLVSVFAYSSDDKFDLSDINSYNYSNRGASINLHHNFNNLLRMNVALVGSQYSFSTNDIQEISDAYTHSYSLNHYEIRTDFIQTINEFNDLSFGISGINYQLDRGVIKPYGEQSLRTPIEHGKEQGIEAALYISDKYDVTSWLNINAGFRLTFYAPLGSNEVYTYATGQPRENQYITDTLQFNSNEVIKWYKTPEFRLSANFKTDPNGTVKLAFNQMSQNLFMLNNTITVAPNTQWKLSDYHLGPSKSNQLSLGVFRNFPELALEGSVELFYKNTTNTPEFKDGADFLNNPVIETEVLQGDQESYGIEFLLKKPRGKLNGWLAYTYSRSYVHIDGDNPWEKINHGKRYPSNFDIPHVFNGIINYNLSKRVTFSAVVTYQKGKPATYPVSVYYIDDTPLIDYSDRNKYRIPDYFRTDVSLTIEGNLKKNKLLHSSWMISVYNLTGRKNAYSVYFISENGYIKSYKYAVIGTQLLTVTWLFKLGNYASQ